MVDVFKACHPRAPPEDFLNLGGRIAGILKLCSGDYGYLLKLIWDTSSADIAGSHLNYIQGSIRAKSKGRAKGEQLPTDEEIRKSIEEA